MKNRKLWFVVIGVVLIAAVLWQALLRKSSPEAFKVGAVFTLTGGTSYWSEQTKKGMDLALQELNVGNGKPVIVVYEDVQGNPQMAAAAMNKLINIDNVSIVISIFTPVSQPLRQIAESRNTPLLATVTSAHEFAKGFKWVFRDFPTQDQMAGALGSFAVEKIGIRTAAALVVNDDYGLDGARQFRRTFQAAGGSFIAQEVFEQKATDIRTQATRVLAGKPEAILVVGRDQSLALAIRQLWEAGFRGQILSVNCLDAKNVWELAGQAVEGAIFASAYVDFEGKVDAKEFYRKFLTKYGQEPDYVNVYGFSITKYLVPIIRQAEGDPSKLRDLLERLNVESIRGQLVTDENHDVRTPIAIYKIEQMRKKLLVTPSFK
jgi:branched-chain amino acid transport system substrate-binding protein